MLTGFDDYPIHQMPVPVAQTGTSDRNHYDRYFFNGYLPEGELFFGGAMGLYPNRQVIDGAFSIIRDGRQKNIYASGRAPIERAHTEVGPVRVEVVEPMKKIRMIVEGCGNRAMTLVVGALERIWTAHERTWAERALRSGCFPHMEDRHVAVIEHQRVLDAIDKGDVAEVIEASRVHLETSQAHQDDDVPPLIDLSSLRPPQRR